MPIETPDRKTKATRHAAPLTELKHVRQEAASLYNFYKEKWRGSKSANEARTLATLLGLVRICIVDDELTRRVEAMEKKVESSTRSPFAQIGAGSVTDAELVRN